MLAEENVGLQKPCQGETRCQWQCAYLRCQNCNSPTNRLCLRSRNTPPWPDQGGKRRQTIYSENSDPHSATMKYPAWRHQVMTAAASAAKKLFIMKEAFVSSRGEQLPRLLSKQSSTSLLWTKKEECCYPTMSRPQYLLPRNWLWHLCTEKPGTATQGLTWSRA